MLKNNKVDYRHLFQAQIQVNCSDDKLAKAMRVVRRRDSTEMKTKVERGDTTDEESNMTL